MNLAYDLIDRNFRRPGGELSVDGVSVAGLASKYGTPFFVYSASVMELSVGKVREVLPDRFDLFYSMKANPNPAVVTLFLAQGCGLEIASGGEYFQAIRAGCSPERIIFAGPGKTESELEEVLTGGIGEIHVESELEAHRIAAIARRLNTVPRVAVRVNASADAEGGAMRMGGRPTPFGTDEESVPDLVAGIENEDALQLVGIHLFTGTQILDHATLLNQYRRGIEIARAVASQVGRPLRTVDFGGGLGIPYFPGESELDVSSFGKGISSLLSEVSGDRNFDGTRFLIEPGRFLVGESGIYVTRVNDVKVSRGKKFLITDGGMNHHLAASGNFGQVIKRNFPVAVLNKLDEARETEVVDVVGPLCTPLDVLARKANLPVASPGDLVGILQSGAYARTASPLAFLSHRSPAEILVRDGSDELIRARGTYEELLLGCVSKSLAP